MSAIEQTIAQVVSKIGRLQTLLAYLQDMRQELGEPPPAAAADVPRPARKQTRRPASARSPELAGEPPPAAAADVPRPARKQTRRPASARSPELAGEPTTLRAQIEAVIGALAEPFKTSDVQATMKAKHPGLANDDTVRSYVYYLGQRGKLAKQGAGRGTTWHRTLKWGEPTQLTQGESKYRAFRQEIAADIAKKQGRADE